MPCSSDGRSAGPDQDDLARWLAGRRPRVGFAGSAAFDGDNATNFRLRNSKVHDAYNPGVLMWLGTPGSNFVLDHNEIYNDINDTDGVVHDECIRVSDLSNLTSPATTCGPAS